ncbi:eukaryotic translation initiation factor 4B2-like isoform X1 [Hibiscus syriacus]|uniref:eukaryotic translation initiation factor 4B2-like isoform X1 n=1 Tax=Hibiscus syriacus TaxID=106335 RepID=UPI00192361B0|nr:eukaryotic translation initiation factor 4B2-like isoform X1 [Hibiscus syriacus]
MSSPWGRIGAWAAEAEREEAEERAAAEAETAAGHTAESQSFPSLKEAVSAKPKKKKKQTLSEFYLGTYSSYGGGGLGGDAKVTEYNRLTPQEMMLLPTGPKERSAEELQYGRLGGGFSSYGRTGPHAGRGMRHYEDSDGSWGSGRRQHGGFNEERRGPSSRVSDFDQSSRADEVDNWAMTKKVIPSMDSGRQNRYGGLGTGGSGGFSKADEADNWTAGKRSIPTRSSTFGSGFADSGPEPDRWSRGGVRESGPEPDRWSRGGVRDSGPEPDRWSRGGVRDSGPEPDRWSRGGVRDSGPEPDRWSPGGGGGIREERPILALDPPQGWVNELVVKTNKSNPFGAAKPREEVLVEKGLDWKKLDSEIEAKKETTRPTSAHSSRPSSAQSSKPEGPLQQGIENAIKPRPKVNPFGDAKPREVLLEERGQDWRKIDLDLDRRRIDRPETEEEKILKDEIDHLKKEVEKNSTRSSEPARDQHSLHEKLLHKERELELLIKDLENKVRFGQKAVERPGSGAGSFSDGPPSQSGSIDSSRSVEFTNRPRSQGTADARTRPRSRGTADAWTRPGDERRRFQGGRDRGFQGNRDMERPRSRERW